MKHLKFRALLQKYAAHTARPDEARAVEAFFDAMQPVGKPTIHPHDAIVENRVLETIHGKLRKGRHQVLMFRVAASLTALLIVAGSLLYLGDSGGRQIAIVAERGEQLTVMLPDSTRVRLNAGTRLSYPASFKGDTRPVTLEGEAYFEVAHDVKKPFIVTSGALTTRVLGTQFSVTAYRNEPSAVTVVSGKVKVTAGVQSVYLQADEQAVAEASGAGLSTHGVHAEDYISWTEGNIFFDHADMNEVVTILNTRFNAHLRLRGSAPSSCTLSGKFPAGSIDGALESIAFINGMTYQHHGEIIDLYVKPCSTPNP